MSDIDDRIRAALDRTVETLSRVVEETADGARGEARREAEREIVALRDQTNSELTSAREAHERDRAEITRAARDEVAVLQRVLDEVRDQHARELEQARERLAEARRDLAESAEEVDTLRRWLDDARQRLAALTGEIDALRRDLDEARDAGRRAEEGLSRSGRLSAALRSLDEAGALGEALDALVQVAAGEAERAVVFLVKGDVLTEWRSSGFEGAGPVPVLAVESGESGMIGEVARSGVTIERAGDPGAVQPAFAGDGAGRHAVGLPLVVGGAVIAVLFADAAIDADASPGWPGRLGGVARHASRVLEALTLHQAAARWARQPERA